MFATTRMVIAALLLVPSFVGVAAAQNATPWDLEIEGGQFLAKGETSSEARDTYYGVGARLWVTDRFATGLGIRVLDVAEGPGESVPRRTIWTTCMRGTTALGRVGS